MDIFIMFLKVFGLILFLFVCVMIFFVYPTNMLYKNDKFEPKGDTDLLVIGGFIFLSLITSLLYFYYHIGDNYLCSLSKYFICIDGPSIGIYVLMFIHLLLIFIFDAFVVNKMKELIKSKKLDLYLFLFASASIFLVLFNYQIYESLFLNEKLLYFFPRVLLYLVVYSPIYFYLIINLIILPRKEKKKKKKKVKKDKEKENKDETKVK